MDDFNINVLSEAKSEYSSRLNSVLTGPIMEGFKAIFKEALDLCIKNEEDTKYLMTFQNFLTRVPRWNQEIINVETNRIIETSKCPYLSDLLTCVHITQLKILTSIRVSNKQKKIDIDIPRLHDYIHKVYITAARKIYQNVYLFEENILPLDKQKNMRECEIIVKESIINVIRENMPIEKILRAYIDETTEEEVFEEIEKIPVVSDNTNVATATATPDTNVATATATPDTNVAAEISGTDTARGDDTIKVKTEQETTKSFLNADIPTTQGLESLKLNTSSPLEKPSSYLVPPLSPSKISFNDTDHVVKYSDNEDPTAISTTTSENISAPKTIDRLEKISTERYEQRKLEEEDDDDDDSIKIHDSNLELNALDIQDISSGLKLNNKPDLLDVEVLA